MSDTKSETWVSVLRKITRLEVKAVSLLVFKVLALFNCVLLVVGWFGSYLVDSLFILY